MVPNAAARLEAPSPLPNKHVEAGAVVTSRSASAVAVDVGDL